LTRIESLTHAHAGIVAIDLHRGHLDPAVATMPLDGGAAAHGQASGNPDIQVKP
jgi:hypothetical protein